MDCSLRVVNKDKDSITVEMLNYDNAILRPFMDELLHDEQVEEARYYIKHPRIDNPQIFVKVNTGKPQAAVKRSIKRLSKVFENMEADLKKETKKTKEVN
jgi:DNA-directed RNA polymerase subunit L